MNTPQHKLGLDQPATYEIRVPGQIGEAWSDWAAGMAIATECQGDGPTVTTLTGTLDQAALHGLLRRLYGLGLPLISVRLLDWYGEEKSG
jgi:hypothetical protein